jgi:phosphomannomutase
MKETNAILAGEMSGHIFYADDYYGYDDGLYAAVRLIQLLQKNPKSLADLYDNLPKRPSTPEIRIACPDDKKFSVIHEIKKVLEKTPAIINDVDGIRIESDKGWWLLRASNTQPALVARCEAIDEASLIDLVKELESNLKDYNLFLPS